MYAKCFWKCAQMYSKCPRRTGIQHEHILSKIEYLAVMKARRNHSMPEYREFLSYTQGIEAWIHFVRFQQLERSALLVLDPHKP